MRVMLFWCLAFSPLLLFFSLIVIIVSIAPVTEAAPLYPVMQQQVLKTFYERTNGNGWSSRCREGWPPTSSAAACSCYGVTCTFNKYFITSLELSNCNLQGTLVASLAQLTRLQKLDLSNNRLTGSLPREWSALVDLQLLFLDRNLLVGTLPTQWSVMQRIQYLYLHANNLRGPVPASWKLKMTSLASSLYQVSCRTSSGSASLMTCDWVWINFPCEMVTVAYNCISPPYGGFEPSCIGVQRNDCPFMSHSASVSDSSTLHLSATPFPSPSVTLSASATPLPSPSVTLSASFSSTSTNNSPSIGGTTGRLPLSITVTPTLSTKEEDETQSRTLVPSPTSSRAAATQTVSLLESVSTSVALLSISATESVSPSRSLSATWSSSPRSHTVDKTFSQSVQRSKSLSVSVSNELDSTPSVLSSRSHTLPVPPPPAGIPAALKSAVVAMGSVAAAGSLLGVDPGGAAVQAALTFLACRKEAPVSDGSFDSWLSTLPVSPFLPLGLIWGALGSVGLAAFFVVLQAACVTILYTFRRYHHHRTAGASSVPAWLDAASVLRFPWVSIIAAEALLAGLAVCGAAAASGAAGNELGHVVAGWVSVTLSLAAVVAWYIAASRLVKPCHAVSTESVLCAQSSPAILKNHRALIPPLYAVLQRSCEWVPVAYTQRNGAFFDAMRGGDGWWWRWVSVAVLTLVAGVTGAGGTRGGGCITSLSVCAVVLLITAVLLALVKPFAMPSENVLNPLKFTLLGCTCATIASVEGDREASILAVLGTLQTVVMVLRLTIRVYTRIEVMYWNYRSGIALTRANEDEMKAVQQPRPISPPPPTLAQNMIHVVSPSSIPPLAGNEGPPPPLRDEEEDAVLFTLLQGTEYANSDDDDLLLRSSGGTLHHHHHGRANTASCNNNGGFFADVFSLSSLTKEELKAVGIQQL